MKNQRKPTIDAILPDQFGSRITEEIVTQLKENGIGAIVIDAMPSLFKGSFANNHRNIQSTISLKNYTSHWAVNAGAFYSDAQYLYIADPNRDEPEFVNRQSFIESGAYFKPYIPGRASMILCTYNPIPEYYEEALSSLKNQNYEPKEILIIDDCSDEPVKNADVRINTPRRGAGEAVAVNTGMAVTNGEFLFKFDDDDILPPYFMEKHIQFFKDPKIMWATCDGVTKFQAESGVFHCFSPPVYRREAFFGAGGWSYGNRGYRYDSDFVRTLHDMFEFRVIPEPMYLYRKHTGSMTWEFRHEMFEDWMKEDNKGFTKTPIEEAKELLFGIGVDINTIKDANGNKFVVDGQSAFVNKEIFMNFKEGNIKEEIKHG